MILQRRRFAYSVVLILILLISACTNMGTGINTSVATAESTDVPTTIPENTPISILLPTETKPAPISLPPIKTQCAGNSNETQKLDLSGVVGLNKAAKLDSSEFGFFLLNLKNGNTIRDVDEGLWTQVSPDRKYVAYEYLKGDAGFLRVLDSNGQTIRDFEFNLDGLVVSYFNWQNPAQLRILHERSNGNKLQAQLLNPFTQEHTPLQTDWNGVYAPKIHIKINSCSGNSTNMPRNSVMCMVQTSYMTPA